MVLKALSEPPSTKLGSAETLPCTAICLGAAPLVVAEMLPDRLPMVAVRLILTNTCTSSRP